MIYKWNSLSKRTITAQVAGEELDRIYQKHGIVNSMLVLDESRNEGAVLHGEFEWDDAIAAEQFRLSQASGIIRAVVTVAGTNEDNTPLIIRAYESVDVNNYQPLHVIASNDRYMAELLRQAMADANAFQKKYKDLNQFVAVFAEMNKLKEES